MCNTREPQRELPWPETARPPGVGWQASERRCPQAEAATMCHHRLQSPSSTRASRSHLARSRQLLFSSYLDPILRCRPPACLVSLSYVTLLPPPRAPRSRTHAGHPIETPLPHPTDAAHRHRSYNKSRAKMITRIKALSRRHIQLLAYAYCT